VQGVWNGTVAAVSIAPFLRSRNKNLYRHRCSFQQRMRNTHCDDIRKLCGFEGRENIGFKDEGSLVLGVYEQIEVTADTVPVS
jgi:hypothetical protein